jgi:hypothetical protein
MVTNLMSEVTEQGAVWLAHLDPAPLSLAPSREAIGTLYSRTMSFDPIVSTPSL